MAERFSAKNVKMEMENDLTRVWAIVGHHPVARFSDASLRCHLLNGTHKVAHQCRIPYWDLVEGRDVLLRDHQEVHRGLWVDILEGQDMVIFIDLGRRDLPPDDLTKEAVGRQTNHLQGGATQDRAG
jgi:hypothetical protein